MTSERHHSDLPLSEEELLLEQLSALLDGELDADERADVEARLTVDEGAREAYEDLRLVRATLASLEPVPAPRSFALRAAEAAPARRPFFQRFDFLLRIGSAAAALLFVVALAGGGSLQTASVPADERSTTILADGDHENAAGVLEATEANEALDSGRADSGAPPEAGGASGPDADGLAPAPENAAGNGGAPAGAPGGAAPDRDAPSGGADADTSGAGEVEPSSFSAPSDDDGTIGGTTAALGALAVLLAALSGVVTWQQRSAARR